MPIGNAALITIAVLMAGTLRGADDPFVGTWKLDSSKSEVKGITEQIQDLGGNKYEFKFGDDAQTIVADGTDQANKWGGTWAIKQDGADKWTETDKWNGKISRTAVWSLSDNDGALTISSHTTRPDGTTDDSTIHATRAGSGSGMCGTWEISDWHAPSLPDWVIKPNGRNGLSLTTPAYKDRLDLKFDGKDYVDVGPRASPGNATSASRPDKNNINLTDKLKGKVMDTEKLTVSDDGKTLTAVVTVPGQSKTITYLYQRQ